MSAVLDDYLNGLLQETPKPAIMPAGLAESGDIPLPTSAVPGSVTKPAAAVTQQVPPEPEDDDADAPAERWLSFRLSGQHYALQVSSLQEVLSWQTLTQVPCAPVHVLGLIHRRGTVVPVLDIRRQLGLGVAGPTPEGALVLLPDGFGIAVDGIADVFVPDDDTQSPPLVGNPMPSVRALTRHAGQTVILLDGTKLLATH